MPTKTDVATQPRKKLAAPPVAKHPPNGKDTLDLNHLLYALQAMRVGNLSVRLAGSQLGLGRKTEDARNEIGPATDGMATHLGQVGRVGGREGRTRQRVRLGLSGGAWGD